MVQEKLYWSLGLEKNEKTKSKLKSISVIFSSISDL